MTFSLNVVSASGGQITISSSPETAIAYFSGLGGGIDNGAPK
jgi:hypothetical protein